MGKKQSKNIEDAQSVLATEHFTSEEIKALRKVYNSFNKKGDELNKKEFRSLLAHCTGIKEVEKLGIDVDEIFDFVDLNKNNAVSFQELIFWLSIYKKGSSEEKLINMFDAFDDDHKGELDSKQVQKLKDILALSLKGKGADATKVADKIITTLDENSDGVITKEEWIKHGLETQLVETLLGKEFMELMSKFKIEGK